MSLAKIHVSNTWFFSLRLIYILLACKCETSERKILSFPLSLFTYMYYITAENLHGIVCSFPWTTLVHRKAKTSPLITQIHSNNVQSNHSNLITTKFKQLTLSNEINQIKRTHPRMWPSSLRLNSQQRQSTRWFLLSVLNMVVRVAFLLRFDQLETDTIAIYLNENNDFDKHLPFLLRFDPKNKFLHEMENYLFSKLQFIDKQQSIRKKNDIIYINY